MVMDRIMDRIYLFNVLFQQARCWMGATCYNQWQQQIISHTKAMEKDSRGTTNTYSLPPN